MEEAARPILFVSSPEPGLINPILVLAGELVRRGTPDVWIATDENRRDDIEAMGASFASLGEVIPELSAVTWDDKVYRAVYRETSRFRSHRAMITTGYMPRLMAAKYRQLEAVVDKVRPAVMVIDSEARYAFNLAIARQIPYVVSAPFEMSNLLCAYVPFSKTYTPRSFPTPHTGLPYKMNPVQQASNRLFRLRTLAMFIAPELSKTLREEIAINKELGVTQPSPMTKVEKAELIFCWNVREFEYPLNPPDNVRNLGAALPPLPQAPDDEIIGWLDARSSVVYISFGTVTRLTRAEVASLAEVARRLDGAHDVLWKLPADQQQLLPPADSLPGNLRIESWVTSQYDVFAHPHVTAFLTHAGGNGFHEALSFGKPMVSRPLHGDCFDVAVRAKDRGVGLTLDPVKTADPGHVTKLINRVLNEPSFRERAKHFAALEQAAGGREKAADLLLSLPALARDGEPAGDRGPSGSSGSSGSSR
jgi:polyene glycosyltransferase